MADDIARLGFEIDTSGLKQGAAAADQLTTSLNKVADAADKQANAERRKTTTQQQGTQATKEAAAATEAAAKAATAHEQAQGKTASTLQTVGTVMANLGMQAQGLTSSFTALSAALGAGGGGGGMGGGIVGGLNAAAGGMGRFAGLLGPVASGVLTVGAGVVTLGAGFAALVASTFKTQEQFLILEGRLKNVYGSSAAAADAFAKITELSNQNGVSVTQTAEAFLRLARNNEAIGLTRKEMVSLTDAVQKLGRVSGASTGELQSGMLQFSQALAAGRLNGDELRSIMENMPALAKAIADGLGVSVGQLRAMGAEGQLTSDKITNSLLGQLPKINAEFANLPQTSEQAFARIASAWDRLIAGMGKQLNASSIVTRLGNAAAAAIDRVATEVTPETEDERYRRILASRATTAQLFTNNAFAGSRGQIRLGVSNIEDPAFEGRYLTEQFKAAGQEIRDRINAPIVRSQSIIQELDDLGTKSKGIREQISTLQQAVESLITLGDTERVAKYKDFIAALERQLRDLRDPLTQFKDDTARIEADMARFGASGAASIGVEGRGLVKSSAAKGVNISEEQAVNAVLERRAVEIEKTAAAMEVEIATQRELTRVVGQGKQAEIEAEVATKAYALQLQMVGKELTPAAAKAIEKYKDNLRELLLVQKEATDQNRLWNAQQELAIQRALSAAQANGANVGQLRALERQLRLNQQIEQEIRSGGSGGAPAGSGAGAGRGADPRLFTGGGVAGEINARAGVNTNLTQTVASVVSEIQRLFPNAVVSSGRRGGSGSSQHDHGNAADFNLTGLSQAERARLVQMLSSGQGAFASVGGLGMYDRNGDLLHVDTRGGQRMAWGPNRSYTSLGQTPDFFQNAVEGWRGTAAGGPGVQALITQNTSVLTQAQREADIRLTQMRRELEDLRRQATAPDARSARRAEQEAQARRYSEDFEPEKQAVAYQERLNQLREEDRLKVAERTRELEEGVRSQEKITAALRKGGVEGRIELQLQQEINEEREKGVELTEREIAARRKAIEASVRQEKVNEEARAQARDYENMWLSVADSIGGAIEGAFREAVMTGKVDAERLLKGLIADIGSAIIRATIVQPLTRGIMSLVGFADGGAFNGGQRLQFSDGGTFGGVIASPRVFAMAGGMGLAGEAGPEAVLPLKRGPDGKLGVSAGGAGGSGKSTIIINDMRSAPGSQPVETEEGTDVNGERIIQIMVRDEVRRSVRSGDLDASMNESYGISRVLAKR